MKHLRLLASINAGWLRQNDRFLPYTSNSILEAMTSPLPAPSLNGEKQTLAMNYKVIETISKKFEIKAGYRHYDYNNNTHVLSLYYGAADCSIALARASARSLLDWLDANGSSDRRQHQD